MFGPSSDCLFISVHCLFVNCRSHWGPIPYNPKGFDQHGKLCLPAPAPTPGLHSLLRLAHCSFPGSSLPPPASLVPPEGWLHFIMLCSQSTVPSHHPTCPNRKSSLFWPEDAALSHGTGYMLTLAPPHQHDELPEEGSHGLLPKVHRGSEPALLRLCRIEHFGHCVSRIINGSGRERKDKGSQSRPGRPEAMELSMSLRNGGTRLRRHRRAIPRLEFLSTQDPL